MSKDRLIKVVLLALAVIVLIGLLAGCDSNTSVGLQRSEEVAVKKLPGGEWTDYGRGLFHVRSPNGVDCMVWSGSYRGEAGISCNWKNQ